MAALKYNRRYDLLGRVSRWLFPVTDSERRCVITQGEHNRIRDKMKGRVGKHLYSVDDGLVIRFDK